MKRIESRDNAEFKALRALVEDAREQRRQGRTLIDGPHLVAAFRQKRGLPEQLLVSESGSANAEIAALLAQHAGVRTVLLRDSLFRELSGVATPAGIAAVIAIPADSDSPPSGSCVLLDAVQDAGNVGSILRSAAAAGIGDVFLGSGCAGVWTPRVLRAAQGAHFDLRLRERCDLVRVVPTLAATPVAAVAAGGQQLYEADLVGPVAWIFGNEGAGIGADLLGLVRCRVMIPMASGSESLNVAAAAAVCLFEGVRQRAASGSAGQ